MTQPPDAELGGKLTSCRGDSAEQRGEHMHVIRFIISYVMVTILGVIMLFFLALNHPKVQIDLLDAQYSVSLPWIMGVAAVFGFLVALLMLLPGRIAAMVNTWSLERDLREVEQQYEELQMLRARLLADHEALVERHERMLIRFQHLVTDHREVVAEQERTHRQIAAPNTAPSVRSAAEPAAQTATRSKGIRSALRLLPPAAPAPAAPAPAAPTMPSPRASAAPPQVQAPATAPAAHTVGATAREVRTAQPAPQPVQQQPVQPPAEPAASLAAAPAPSAPAAPAPAPVAAAPTPAAAQPKLVPVLTDPPASAPPARQPQAQEASPAATEAQTPRKPLVTAATLRRPVERLREGARQGWQRAEVRTERLRERVAGLRAGVEARLQRARSTPDTIDDGEPSQADMPDPHDDDD